MFVMKGDRTENCAPGFFITGNAGSEASRRTLAKIFSHTQAGAIIDPFELDFVHQSSDQFQSPTASFFSRF